MASKRRQRRRSCQRKIRYETPEKAIMARYGTNKTFGTRVDVYKCRFCKGYHLGHNPHMMGNQFKMWTGSRKGQAR